MIKKQLEDRLAILLQDEVELIPRENADTEELMELTPQNWRVFFDKNTSNADLIRTIWKPVEKTAQAYILELIERTNAIFLVVSKDHTLKPSLYYVFESKSKPGKSYFGWLAGYPVAGVDYLILENQLGFSLPASYKVFTEIHNGFTLDGNKSHGILPVQNLQLLSGMNWLDQTKINYDPANFLEFGGDGMGNAQCFDLTFPTEHEDFMTILLDHETQKLYHPITFWDFLESLIGITNK